MFQRLRESTRSTDRSVMTLSGVSLGFHAALALVGLYALGNTGRNTRTVQADTTIVFLESPVAPREDPVQLDMPLQGFQTLVLPSQISPSIPPIDLQQRFDPQDYSGIGMEGGLANGVMPAESQVYAPGSVEEAPALLSAPPAYPEPLRRAGIEGHVVLQAILDTAGRVEPNSVKILESSSAGFDLATRRWALTARFRPARQQGRPVRVLVNLPVDFSGGTP